MGVFELAPLKKKYDEKTSLSLALACELAYKDEDEILATVKSWGFDLVEFFSISKDPDIDTQAFIMSSRRDTIIVFRGSNHLSDWLGNFQATYNPGPLVDTKAHEGFQDALFPAVIKLTDIIDRFHSNRKRIWLTGHSLGGALASLYAGMLIENDYDVHGIYTFGSPRPGNPSFADQLNKHVKGPHYRVVNFGDVVAHLPPEPFYSHSGNRIILREGRHLTKEDSWMKQRFIALREFVRMTGQIFDVADNHMLRGDNESYIPRLERELQNS